MKKKEKDTAKAKLIFLVLVKGSIRTDEIKYTLQQSYML
jgi:hypothetical protein